MTQVVAEVVSVGEAAAEAGAAANTVAEAAEAVVGMEAEAVAVFVVEVATVAVGNATAEAIIERDFVQETVAPPPDDFVTIGSIAA